MSAEVPPLTADAQVARIFALRRGFNTIHLIDVGIKLGVFRALAEAPDLTAEALAERLRKIRLKFRRAKGEFTF